MPHLVLLYTPQIEEALDWDQLCHQLADTMRAQRDEQAKAVFPMGGIRVLALPVRHFAVADGGAAGVAANRHGAHSGDYAFVYAQLRMGRGRSTAVHHQVGQALRAVLETFFAPLQQTRPVGVTLQIDEGQEVYDAKLSNLHPLFH